MSDRVIVGLARPAVAKGPIEMPDEAPQLRFVRAIHESGFVPRHELAFCGCGNAIKPPGAVRLELFVDLIPPDADVTLHYQKEGAARPVYLRSYVKSPIRLVPPMAESPMRVVYWARWADAAGEVGPFATPVAGWVEGGSHHLLAMGMSGQESPMPWIAATDDQRRRETTVVLALLNGDAALAAAGLPEPARSRGNDVRRLAGPAAEAA